MTASLFLSRARLRSRRGEALASVAPLLLPTAGAERNAAAHRIVWLLFQSEPDAGHEMNWRQTDNGYLWRDDGDGRYLILSRVPPSDPHDLFELETKEFAPQLRAGDRLKFALRANPVVASKSGFTDEQKRNRGKRVDVVMNALKSVPRTDWTSRTGRAFARDDLVTETTQAWLAQQGSKHGFKLSAGFVAEGYSQVQVARSAERRRRSASFSVVNLAGEITVTDPAALLARLPLGFGAAKAFGCGLMLIRRAPL